MGVMKRIALDPDLRRAFRGGRLSIVPTEVFFDRAKVQRAMDKATHEAMHQGAARIRRTAQTSMRYVTDTREQARQVRAGTRSRAARACTPSRPGEPPRAVRPHPWVRRHLYYSYSRPAKNAVIGPQALARGTDAPHTLEFGGPIVIKNKRRRIRKLGAGGEIRMSGGVVYAKLRTQRQVDRANRINEQLYGPLERRAHMEPRPFMGPALAEERPRLPWLWHNSVKG